MFDNFFTQFDWLQVINSFILMAAIIDPLGNMPYTLSLEEKGEIIKPKLVCFVSFLILVAFLFVGEGLLRLFDVDINAFAVAGAMIIFIMGLEMVLDVDIFQNRGPKGSGSFVPLAFPMFAGPGAFAALLSITTKYAVINLLVSIFLNMVFLYLVLVGLHWIKRNLGDLFIYVVRKVLGVVVLAIAVQMFCNNCYATFQHSIDQYKTTHNTEQVVSDIDQNENTIQFENE